jgi:hypothetical protein
MKPDFKWKLPTALGMVLCSLVPVLLFAIIEHIEVNSSMWAYKHRALSFIAWTFQSYYLFGLILPILTAGVAVWVIIGESLTRARLAWLMLMLLVLHLFWLSYGILAFYFTNQNFVL